MKDNGIDDPLEVDTIVKAASKITKDKTTNVSELMGCAKRMLELEGTNGVSYSELEKSFNDLVTKKEKTGGGVVKELNDQVQQAESRKKIALDGEKTTEIQLKDYVQARDGLSSLGVDVENLPKLRNMLLNGVEVDFDQHKMITNISKSESLIEVMSDLDKKIEVKKLVDAGLDHKIKASNRELEVLQNAITNLAVAIKKSNDYVEEFRKTTDSIKELAETSVQGAKTQIKDIADSVNTNLKIVNAALNEV